MAKAHSKWKDDENTRYPTVNPPGEAGWTGGGSGNREPLVREAKEAMEEFDNFAKRIPQEKA